MLSEGMKKLFQKEHEWADDGLHDGRKATLDDLWITFNSFDADELERIAGTPIGELDAELSRLRSQYGENAELKTVEEQEQ